MAQRRMFSKDITGSDAFSEMPISSQLLYFQLGMEADDDGFVGSPKKVSRLVGVGDDDLRILSAKRFILVFPTGVVVIKHWKINNYIQKDRYHETKYLEEKKAIITKENGSYTECIQNVSRMDTQARLELELVKANLTANAEKETNKFTIGTMPLSLEDLSDDTITYESIDTRKSTPKKYNRGKLMARLAVNYMQRKGEEGNVLRHYPVMKEIIDKSIDVLTKENLPVTEENITKCVLIRFDLAEEQFNGKWGLNAINNHFNRLTQ